ncbi:MAG: type II secretion system F family protein [Flavobacteriaceae bacterium]|nr:type II secretion system F family protein [Flavobacteriaceae bacterium]
MAFKLKNIENHKKEEASIQRKSILQKEITFLNSSFNNKIKEAFYSELSVLLNAGISLKESFTLIIEQQKKAKNKSILNDILSNIIKGESFSDAVKKQKDFSEYEYYSLKIGEETGTLIKVTEELGKFFNRRNEQKKNVMNAISYPIIVFTTAFLSVLFMLKYVVPMFADIFKQNGVELPWITKLIITFSKGLEKYFWLIVIIGIALLFIKRLLKKNIHYKKITTGFILKIPFFGELVRKMYLAQFTQAIALLTSAKIPVLNSLQLTKKMIDYYPLQFTLESVEKSVLSGKSLSISLKPYPIFDNKMISLIKVAEESNRMEYVFDKLTTQYNDEIQYKSKMLSTVLEPLIIIVLGAIVAIILIAMYLPMFKLSTVMG